MHHDQMKGFLILQRKKIIICCLGEYFEVSGITDDLDDKKIVHPNIVNSVVEGSYY